MSVHASASFTLALGWMSGGVSILLGFEAEYHKKPAQHAAFSAAIFLLFTGYVDILSLISVHLYLLMQASYKSLGDGGSELVGSGQIKVTIRICRFVKITVDKTYTKVIARSHGSGSPAPPPKLAPAAMDVLNAPSDAPVPPDAAIIAKTILASLA